MKILEELEELKKEQDALPEELDEEGDDLPEEVVEEQVVSEEEEQPAEEKPVEEPKEETPSAAAFYKMRKELAELKKAKQEPKEVTPEQQTEAFNSEIVEVIKENRVRRAEKEFADLETSFAQYTPGYEDTEDTVGVSSQYKMTIYQAIKAQNPRKSHAALLEDTKNALLQKAGGYLNQGLDPIEEMYNDALALGIKPQKRQQETQEQPTKTPLKPDLSKVAANQKRNAGTAAARGSSGEAEPSLDFVAAGDVKEWLRLNPAQKKAYLDKLKQIA